MIYRGRLIFFPWRARGNFCQVLNGCLARRKFQAAQGERATERETGVSVYTSQRHTEIYAGSTPGMFAKKIPQALLA